MQYDIFISYKRLGVSSASAAFIYDLLTKKGYNVFFDRKEIRQGRFNEQLLTHIEGAQDILILLEQNSLNSCFNGIADSYKTDWFCMEIMHAIKNKKRIIPLLLDGYKMPSIQDLPSELKPLSLENAIPFDASDIEEFYKKYLIEQGYLLSKPRNLFISNLNGTGVADFLFYSDGNCSLYEFGNLIGTLDQNVDEKHPYIYTVKRAGEHRFECKNNDTCEVKCIEATIEKDTQKYVPIQWRLTQNLWELTIKDIEEQEDSNILFFWGQGLFDGTITHEPNWDLSFKCLEKAAQLWNLDAKCFIVNNVNTVVHKVLEQKSLIPWLKLASDFGSSTAQYNLGELYLHGKGVERNGSMARKYFELAAEDNHIGASHSLGWMFTEGIGVKRNYSKGRYWFDKSASMGNHNSMLCLGELFQYGRGVKKNLDTALSWYNAAEKKGSAKSYISIGSIYYGLGKYHDYSKAFDYFKKGAEQGGNDLNVAMSKVMSSIMMKEGIGTHKDIEKAEQLLNEVYEIATTFKHAGMFYNSLAWQLFLMGIYDTALQLALKSIEYKSDDPASLDTLGAIYKSLKEYDKAIDAYNKCLSLGKKSAQQDIDSINKLIKRLTTPSK